MSQVFPNLSDSIQLLYQVFAKYPLNSKMSGSPLYGELAQWNQALAAKPLRQLTAEDLAIFHFKAITTWGSLNDFKHFLPRIYELLSELPLEFDGWVALDKLRYGKYRDWPENEQTAVHQFLTAFWWKLLTEKSDIIDACFNSYFPAIANVYPNFGHMLELWLAADNQDSGRRLACFICDNEKKVVKKNILPGYEDMAYQSQLFTSWLKSPAALEKLKQTVPSEARPYICMELAPVLQQLQQLL